MVTPRCVSVKMIMSARWARATALRVSHLANVRPLRLNRRVLRVAGVGFVRVCRGTVGGGGCVTFGCGGCGGVFQVAFTR
jgi:hypothetical protein